MRIVSKSLTLAVFVFAAAGSMGACTRGGGIDLTRPSSTISFSSSAPIRLVEVGQRESRNVIVDPLPIQETVNFSSSNTSVATVSPSSASASAVADTKFVVTAVNFGTATLHVTADSGKLTADIPIAVWPNGTWKGLVRLENACPDPPPPATYDETVDIAVNDSGIGTMFVTDAAGFNRQYSITIPSSPSPLTFTSTGSFLYNNGITISTVGGAVEVALRGNKLAYGEITNWPDCADHYVGDQTKQ